MRMPMSFMKVNTEVKMNSTECFFFQPTDYTSSATVCKWCGKEKYQHKSEQKQLIIDILNEDAKDGLYKQQTAVEWLIEQLIPKDQHEGIMDIIKEAKEMEKQQIVDAWNDGHSNTDLKGNPSVNYAISAEHYYNQKYGSNNEQQ